MFSSVKEHVDTERRVYEHSKLELRAEPEIGHVREVVASPSDNWATWIQFLEPVF